MWNLRGLKTNGSKSLVDSIMEEAKLRRAFTPDLNELQLKRKQYLFVYDKLKFSFPDHDALGKCEMICSGVTIRDEFELIMHAPTGQVAMYECPDKDPEDRSFNSAWPGPDRVKGELYLVDTECVINLDAVYQNTVLSDRRRLRIKLPWDGKHYRKVRGMWMPSDEECYLPAFAFLAKPEVIGDLAKSDMKLTSRFVPAYREDNFRFISRKPYYEFTKRDLKECQVN
jgi:gamma-glutamylcyclotransferase (GGCT)/AIG2-like uncharacterized protein YtfP